MNFIDLRSDTVTWPTQAMRDAMASALVGDDVYGDDPTVIELERYGANLLAKEAALFVPTGTFGNQLALFTHCPRGSEVILDDECHIVQHEAGGSAIIAGVQLRTVKCPDYILTADEITRRIRIGEDIHEPRTSLICLENAHSAGKVIPIKEMEAIRRTADRHHIPVHLDGARIFNAATSLGVQAKDISQYTDSVMACLSKGLCAPVGSLLAGTRKFIEQARRNRKLLGGGLRQAGILAAAGLIALKNHRNSLDADHMNARFLAENLATISGIEVYQDRLDINMVFFRHAGNRPIDPEAFADHLKEHDILINPPGNDGVYRLVTHHWISREATEKTVQVIRNWCIQD